MKTLQLKTIIIILGVLGVIGISFMTWRAHENSPEVQAKKAQAALDAKFKQAPKAIMFI